MYSMFENDFKCKIENPEKQSNQQNLLQMLTMLENLLLSYEQRIIPMEKIQLAKEKLQVENFRRREQKEATLKL